MIYSANALEAKAKGLNGLMFAAKPWLKPIATQHDESFELPPEINALENLRPMWYRKNCAKKNKWEGQ